MTQFFSSRWPRWSAVAASAVLIAACGKGQQAMTPAATDKAAAPPVATVDGTPISRADYDFYTKRLLQGRPNTELTAEQKSQILIAAQAVKDGLEKDPDVATSLQVLRLRILADAESQKYLKDKEPTDAELHAEYDTAVGGLDKTEYHARHILVATKEQGEAAIKKVKGGAKFEDVAKAESTDTSKASGGDLGWFTLARMAKPFGDAVKTLKKGEVTPEPVQTQFGWHVIKLEDTREQPPPPFEQVKQQVASGVMQKKLAAHVEELKKNAKIEKTL
jgi:peptidyl-prolyl cis-trans isomerase C